MNANNNTLPTREDMQQVALDAAKAMIDAADQSRRGYVFEGQVRAYSITPQVESQIRQYAHRVGVDIYAD